MLGYLRSYFVRDPSILDTLPQEILYIIGKKLSFQDIHQFCLINKRFSKLCNTNQFWVDQIHNIAPGRGDAVTNGSLVQLKNIYKKICLSGYLYLNGTFRETIYNRPQLILEDDNVTQAACGEEHFAYITDEGELYTVGTGVGYDDHGKLKQISVSSPILQVACGRDYTAFITDAGYLYTFGSGPEGQLGQGEVTILKEPTRVGNFTSIIDISCGSNHTAFIDDEGRLYTYGKLEKGNLGRPGDPTRPQLVSLPENIIKVYCGGNSTMALSESGKIYVWGDNNSNKFDLPGRVLTPRLFKLSRYGKSAKDIACGDTIMAFILEDGTLCVKSEGDEMVGRLPAPDPVFITCGDDDLIYVDSQKYAHIYNNKTGTGENIRGGSRGPVLGDIIYVAGTKEFIIFISQDEEYQSRIREN